MQAPTGARSEPQASEAAVDPGFARIRTRNAQPSEAAGSRGFAPAGPAR